MITKEFISGFATMLTIGVAAVALFFLSIITPTILENWFEGFLDYTIAAFTSQTVGSLAIVSSAAIGVWLIDRVFHCINTGNEGKRGAALALILVMFVTIVLASSAMAIIPRV